jgi:hypothetical protein
VAGLADKLTILEIGNGLSRRWRVEYTHICRFVSLKQFFQVHKNAKKTAFFKNRNPLCLHYRIETACICAKIRSEVLYGQVFGKNDLILLKVSVDKFVFP